MSSDVTLLLHTDRHAAPAVFRQLFARLQPRCTNYSGTHYITGPVAALDLGPGFPDSDVLAVVGTAEATWVALGAGGVTRIAPDGTVTPLDLPAGMHSQVWDLAVAGADLWLATRGSGVLHYDGATWTQFTRSTAALPSDEVAP
jgi:hypothetical protein